MKFNKVKCHVLHLGHNPCNAVLQSDWKAAQQKATWEYWLIVS